MADDPRALVRSYLRRLDAKVDRSVDDRHDSAVRLTGGERGLARVKSCIDRVSETLLDFFDKNTLQRPEKRAISYQPRDSAWLGRALDRIERRFDLVELPH